MASGGCSERARPRVSARRRSTASDLTTGTGGHQTRGATGSSLRFKAPMLTINDDKNIHRVRVTEANCFTLTRRREGLVVTVARSGRLTTGRPWTNASSRSRQGLVRRASTSPTTPPAGRQNATASKTTCTLLQAGAVSSSSLKVTSELILVCTCTESRCVRTVSARSGGGPGPGHPGAGL